MFVNFGKINRKSSVGNIFFQQFISVEMTLIELKVLNGEKYLKKSKKFFFKKQLKIVYLRLAIDFKLLPDHEIIFT